MKQPITSTVFVISFVSLLVLGLVSRVQAGEGQCSNASIKGTYGHSCQGTVVGGGPIAVVGVLTADGNGKASEVETLNVSGDILRVPFDVNYTVNADCTGSFESTAPDGSVFLNDFVIDDNKKEIRLIVTDPPGFVVVCIYRKQ
jgi:hypothetical protein